MKTPPTKRYLYAAVQPDEYELPIAVADSPSELAGMLGISANALTTSICRGRSGTRIGLKFIKLEDTEEAA